MEYIGRYEEKKSIKALENASKAEFLALYGRRRIGKTQLVRSLYKDSWTFQATGMANVGLQDQLSNFYFALKDFGLNETYPKPKDWISAFQYLKEIVQRSGKARKIIFLDELPWFDTPGSKFIAALEHFWNHWASAQNDIFLIGCGSAASWMINTLIKNKGGLHNRVTARIKLKPFSLAECEEFCTSRKLKLTRYQILQLYMCFGGIPYYWEQAQTGKSAAAIIQHSCFEESSILRNEFSIVFRSLFSKAERHEAIVRALAKKRIGLQRNEIAKHSGLSNGGGLTRLLTELEESGFIQKYHPFGKKNRLSLYQLTDFYSLFYLNFIEDHTPRDTDHWMKLQQSPSYLAWSGYAFEQVCLAHADKIKKALGISGVQTHTSSWRSTQNNKGAQIDLVIDRKDETINLCEMKFSVYPFIITKKYAQELRNKMAYFQLENKTKKALFITLITTYGVANFLNYADLVQNQVTMEDLFM